jgi:hypothetical protein
MSVCGKRGIKMGMTSNEAQFTEMLTSYPSIKMLDDSTAREILDRVMLEYRINTLHYCWSKAKAPIVNCTKIRPKDLPAYYGKTLPALFSDNTYLIIDLCDDDKFIVCQSHLDNLMELLKENYFELIEIYILTDTFHIRLCVNHVCEVFKFNGCASRLSNSNHKCNQYEVQGHVPTEIAKMLNSHKRFLDDEPDGKRADLHGADLQKANLYGANLQDANLKETDLRGADLRRANLRNANLRGACLQDANLRHANLSCAELSDVNLQKADLFGANCTGADLRRANLQSANLHRTDLCGAFLQEANLCDAELRNASLLCANLCGINLRGTDLRSADLSYTELHEIIAVSPIGSMNDIVIWNMKYDQLWSGSFGGTLAEFETKIEAIHAKGPEEVANIIDFVEETHSDTLEHLADYRALIVFLRAVAVSRGFIEVQ